VVEHQLSRRRGCPEDRARRHDDRELGRHELEVVPTDLLLDMPEGGLKIQQTFKWSSNSAPLDS
jgi:hypothetical protein